MKMPPLSHNASRDGFAIKNSGPKHEEIENYDDARNSQHLCKTASGKLSDSDGPCYWDEGLLSVNPQADPPKLTDEGIVAARYHTDSVNMSEEEEVAGTDGAGRAVGTRSKRAQSSRCRDGCGAGRPWRQASQISSGRK